MSFKVKSIYISTYKKVFKLLPKSLKKQFLKIQILIFFTTLVDLFGLATLIPVLSVVADESALEGDGFLAKLKNYSGIENNHNFLLALFLISFGFLLLRSLFIFYSQWKQSKFTFSLGEYIGKKTYKYYLSLDYENFSKKDSAQILRELTTSPGHFSSFLISPFLLINTELIVLVLIISGIAIYNIQVFFILLITIIPISFLFQKLVKKKMSSYGKSRNKFMLKLLTTSNRASNGYVDVKLRAKEDILVDTYGKAYEDINRINIRTNVLSIIPSKLFELAAVGGLVIIFVYGAFIAENSSSVFQLIVIYAAAGYRMIPSLGKLSPAMMQLEQYQYLIDIYKEPLLFQGNEEKKLKNIPIKFYHDIELKSLQFQFKNSEDIILKNIDLTIKKGEIVGLIGKSGSGKTTLVKLLAGLLIPTQGEILIDGIKLTKENTAAWMQQISYVQQTPYIEKGTLSENIAFLEKEIDEERLQKAIEGASLLSLLGNQNPHEFLVDENGKNLSGGQKQRIIIARALYHQAQFIILDEATSALDNETEAEINETVAQLKGTGVTVIIIAHRISTLKHTDRIIEVLNKNKNQINEKIRN